MVGENFQIYGAKITRKHICESKYWIYSFLIFIFTYVPKQNPSPDSYLHPHTPTLR